MTLRTYTTKVDGSTVFASHVNQVQTDLTSLSVISAKGSLCAGGTAGAETEVVVGLDGQALYADSTQATGLAWGAGSDLYANREMQALANAGAATLTTVGFTAAPTVTGTQTSTDDADGPWNNFASGAVSGNVGGLNSAATVAQRNWNPEFVAYIKLPATITSCRYWIGLFSGAPTGADTNASVHAAGFRFSTGAGDTTWQCVTCDGSTQSTVDSTVAATASTAYRLRVRLQASQVLFYVNDVLRRTATVNLPAVATMLSWYATVTTTASQADNLKISRVALIHK